MTGAGTRRSEAPDGMALGDFHVRWGLGTAGVGPGPSARPTATPGVPGLGAPHAASVVVALASATFALSASGDVTRTILHRIRQTDIVRHLPAAAPGLLTSDTSLGILTDIPAYEQHATSASAGGLTAAASQPLVDSIPALQSPVSSIAFSPDGKTVASGFDGGVLTRNLATGKTVFPSWAAQLGAGIQDVAYSPDGKRR